MQPFAVERPNGNPRLNPVRRAAGLGGWSPFWLLGVGALLSMVVVAVWVMQGSSVRPADTTTSTIIATTTKAGTTTTTTKAGAKTTTTTPASGSSSGKEIFHGYETMKFYLRNPSAVYLASECSPSVVRSSDSQSSKNGLSGPFELKGQSTQLRVCSGDDLDLGMLKIHKDPCDPIGEPARIGIANMGNSCFLNAAMQLLLGIPGICAAIFDESNINDPKLSPIPALRDFTDNYRASSTAVKREDAKKFRQALKDLKIVQSISGQEDSGEALVKFFNLYDFHDLHSPFISTICTHVAFQKQDMKEDTTAGSGSLNATCKDEDCRTDGAVEQTALVPLALPFEKHEYIALDDVLELSFPHLQEIEHDDPVRVHVLPNPVRMVTKFANRRELTKAPQLLFSMQLEMYDMDLDRVAKRKDKIMVPAKHHDMMLVGLTQHLGEDDAGHYIAYKRRCIGSSSDKEWIQYDDAHTSLQPTNVALEAAHEGKLLYFALNPKLPSCDSLAIA